MNPEVTLRPFRIEDAMELSSIANSKKVWMNVRDRFPHPYTVQNALEWITQASKQEPAQTWAIIYNGAIAGTVGVILKDDVYRKSIEIGYFIGEPYWGKGIATKAVELLLVHISQQYDVIRIYAEVFEHNKASMRVLQKNGFVCESTRKRAVIKNNEVMDDQVWVKFAD